MKQHRTSICALITVVLLATAGCGKDKRTNPVPPSLPVNDTPRNLLLRFREVYQQREPTEYPQLFTTNFRFQFSAATDPQLAALYGDNWDMRLEARYADRLFNGFRDSTETYPAASRIAMSFDPFPTDDPARMDSTDHYKTLIVPTLHLEIEVPTGPEHTTYLIDGRYQFWLVRGDAAQLTAGQPPDSTRWYIYRWEDQSTYPDGFATRAMEAPLPTDPSTWGRIKGMYVHQEESARSTR